MRPVKGESPSGGIQADAQADSDAAQFGPITAREAALAAAALGASGGGTHAAELLSLLYDDTVESSDILRSLRSEPTLASRVLRVANSSYYRRAGAVGTLERALQVLGLASLRGIAAVGCMDRIPVPTVGSVLDERQFRRHSIAVAAAAQGLCKRCGAGIEAESFIAGLLHSLGIVVLARLRPPAAAALAALPPMPPASIRQAEVDLWGIDHATASEILAREWKLPIWLSSALRADVTEDYTPRTGTDVLPDLLAIGEYCAREAGFGLWVSSIAAPTPERIAVLGLGATDCDEVIAELPEQVQMLCGN